MWFLQRVALKSLEKLSKKTDTDLDDTFIKIFKSIRPSFYNFLALYLSLLFLTLNSTLRHWLGVILLVFVVYQVIKAVHVLIDYIIEKKTETENKDAETAFKFLGSLLKWSLWVVGLILILSNLGINVSSLIAGLGIGGIAVALALQGILTDLFSASSLDFEVIYFIESGDYSVYMNAQQEINLKIKEVFAKEGIEMAYPTQTLYLNK